MTYRGEPLTTFEIGGEQYRIRRLSSEEQRHHGGALSFCVESADGQASHWITAEFFAEIAENLEREAAVHRKTTDILGVKP